MTPVDLRHLVPPEPMEIILDAADQLQSGQTLGWILPHHPTPLLPMLTAQNINYRFELSGDGGVILYINKA